MRALNRKLLRDLLHMKGQAAAIALVIAAGAAMFVAYFSTFDSLRGTLDTYYTASRFADLFANVKRAPLSLRERLVEIPGVADVELRVVVDVTLDVPALIEPSTGRLISIRLPRQRPLNDVFLRRGRDPEIGRPDEVLVDEAFADARKLRPGDRLGAIINGRRRDLVIVGIALSPEYVYSMRAGDLLPDPSRFGIFWMERRALAAAFNMEGAFNDVSIALAADANEPHVSGAVEHVLAPYGGFGLVPRRQQTSNWFLQNELAQLQGVGIILPLVFFGVAAFLVNVVLHRMISVQREQIAALKALGYSNLELGFHYLKWSLAVSLAGGVIALGAGAWLGRGMTGLYNVFFRFPELAYHVRPVYMLEALLATAAAAIVGATAAVRRAVTLPPAEAMRPEAPASFRETLIERIGLRRYLSPPARMVLRNVARHPLRSTMAVVGIAFGVAILVVGLFMVDSIEELLRVQFGIVQRQDVTTTFVEPVSAATRHELERLPGVLSMEAMRSLPVRIRAGHRSRQTAITGLQLAPQLNRVIDSRLRPVELSPEGLVLSAVLADVLGVRRGDEVVIEVLEGTRPVRRARITQTVDEYMGMSVYMEIGALARLMREAGSLSGAYLRIDPAAAPALYQRLKRTPLVAGVSLKQAAVESFRKTIAQNMNVMIIFNVIFAAIIAFGVVYNAARIALSERSRDLASLRVLGFTRGEVSTILLGELAVIVLAALPVGLLLGQLFAALVVKGVESELYRFPLFVTPRTRLFAAGTVAAAAIISGLVVRRRVDHLDLVAVLKTRE